MAAFSWEKPIERSSLEPAEGKKLSLDEIACIVPELEGRCPDSVFEDPNQRQRMAVTTACMRFTGAATPTPSL